MKTYHVWIFILFIALDVCIVTYFLEISAASSQQELFKIYYRLICEKNSLKQYLRFIVGLLQTQLNIIVNFKIEMSTPFKTTLMEFELTPAKVLVAGEINGWMETNLKRSCQQLRNKPSKGAFKKIASTSNTPNEKSNFEKLRMMRLSLLKESSNYNFIRKYMPPTAESSNNSNGSASQVISGKRTLAYGDLVNDMKCMKIKLIQVSQFTQKDQPLHSQASKDIRIGRQQSISCKNIEANRKMPPLRTKRALSSQRQKGELNHIILGKQADIYQSKITQNHYRGLNFISRKLNLKK